MGEEFAIRLYRRQFGSLSGNHGGLMDDEMNTQLRTVTFSEERKGFDKGEVRRFLNEVAEWIEGGGGDVVRRRLERIAHKSANMLADAEDGAESLRREAEEETRELLDQAKGEADAYRVDAEAEARDQLREARAEATSCREAANLYASETNRKADEYASETNRKADEYAAETNRRADKYADQTRAEAKRESDKVREDASVEAREIVLSAEAKADQLVAAANRQREDIETVIGDLGLKRDAVMAQVRKFALELEGTVDSLEAETDGPSPAAAASTEQTEAPVLELAADSGDEGESLEELRVDSGLVRNGNGSRSA
jgi:cell division septum initiation protein DivIVA